MSAMYNQFWVEVSATHRKSKQPQHLTRGPFDSFAVAQSVAKTAQPLLCTVENATISHKGKEVIGYRSTKGVWTWDAAPKEWES